MCLLSRLGWHEFVKRRRGRGDITSLKNVKHPARRLLFLLESQGAPVQFSTPPWSRDRLDQAIKQGPHRSCKDYIDFLEEKFVDMIQKGQWVILPASVARRLKGLRASPPGVVPQRDRRPRWICDYTWSSDNAETLDIAPKETMQIGQALDQVLREILLANPSFGHVYLNKTDLSDGFYRVDVNPDKIPKLGVVFPSRPGHREPYIALSLVLPMGRKNSPPYFSAVTFKNHCGPCQFLLTLRERGDEGGRSESSYWLRRRRRRQRGLFFDVIGFYFSRFILSVR